MHYTEDILIADNKRLAQKLQELEAHIPELELRQSSQYDSEFTTYGGGAYSSQPSRERDDGEEETLESVMYCISATEELCGVSVYDYKSVILPPSEGLPPGKWREVSMNILVLDSLKAAITVIEGQQNGIHRVLSLECMAGETPLERNELSGLIQECCHSTPPQCEKLLTFLAEYAKMWSDRRSVIKEFKENHHDNVRVHTSEDSVIVQWRGRLFEISWSVQWCEKTEVVQNMISVEIGHHANPAFIRESEASVRRLIEFTATPESRLECLRNIARYSMTHN